VLVDSKLLADQEISVISTYLNDNAHTPLNRFDVYTLNKQSDKTNRWSLSLSLSVDGLKRRRCDQQKSVVRAFDDSTSSSGEENGF